MLLSSPASFFFHLFPDILSCGNAQVNIAVEDCLCSWSQPATKLLMRSDEMGAHKGILKAKQRGISRANILTGLPDQQVLFIQPYCFRCCDITCPKFNSAKMDGFLDPLYYRLFGPLFMPVKRTTKTFKAKEIRAVTLLSTDRKKIGKNQHCICAQRCQSW